MSAVWTMEKVEQLKALVAEGRSYSYIGSKLGVTRNAAIGKAGRIGLGNGPRPPRAPKVPRQTRVYRPRTKRERRLNDFKFAGQRPLPANGPAESPSTGVPAHLIPEPDASERRSLFDRGLFCRWLYDDGLACGHHVHKNSSWCAYHFAICIQPQPKRRAS